jgi:hypothetical protein
MGRSVAQTRGRCDRCPAGAAEGESPATQIGAPQRFRSPAERSQVSVLDDLALVQGKATVRPVRSGGGRLHFGSTARASRDRDPLRVPV